MLGHGLGDPAPGLLPDRRGPGCDCGIASQDAVLRHLVAAPGGTLGARVEENRLEAVYGVRKARRRGRLFLEFVPERPELPGLVGGQEPEDPVRGDRLARVLVRHGGRVVGKGVPGVDLHQVVDEKHLKDPQDVQARLVRML